MRRVVVTPTFAAGLGVVVAAVLAYPVQTVFSYVAPGALGRGEMQCGQGGCSQSPPTGKPEPLGVGGGALNPSPPAAAQPGQPADNDGSSAATSRQPTGTGGTETAQPQLSYKITSKWQGGFWGQITITFPGTVPANWHLRFGFPRGHILGLNPDGQLASNGHAAVVRSSDYAAGSVPGRRTFAVGAGVQGMPARPARCSFDGKACHLG